LLSRLRTGTTLQGFGSSISSRRATLGWCKRSTATTADRTHLLDLCHMVDSAVDHPCDQRARSRSAFLSDRAMAARRRARLRAPAAEQAIARYRLMRRITVGPFRSEAARASSVSPRRATSAST
jgi:hypothetical protein